VLKPLAFYLLFKLCMQGMEGRQCTVQSATLCSFLNLCMGLRYRLAIAQRHCISFNMRYRHTSHFISSRPEYVGILSATAYKDPVNL
jgi:hypothetical protein